MTIKVSTFGFNSSRPMIACCILSGPSKTNGLVTIPMVKIPISFAIRATTGAAPVPVPPPMPAVINTISAFDRTSRISFSDSRAACFPISGLAPAPNPRVNLFPN